MPVTATELPRLSDVLKVTDNQLYSAGYMTKTVTLNQPSDTDIVLGTMLGEIGSTDVWIESLTGAGDGSEVPSVLLIENVSALAGVDQEVLVMVRGGGIVGDKALNTSSHALSVLQTALEGMNPPLVVASQL